MLTTLPRRNRSTSDWAAPCLLLVTPLVIFFRYQGYPLLASDSLLCIAAFVTVGLTLAVLTAALGNSLRIPLYAVLVTLFVDVQSGASSDSFTRLALIAGASTVAGVLIRSNLSALVCVVCGTLLVTSIVFPVGDPFARDFVSAQLPVDSEDLTPLVHIILDEQIGVEGLPAEFDPGGRRASTLKHFYLDRGFTVYGKAYSISMHSRLSIATAMNFTVDSQAVRGLAAPVMRKAHFGENAYFAEMARRGYRIHVYQTDYMDYCRDEKGDSAAGVDTCSTYPLESISSIGASPMTIADRASLIAGVYSRLSFGLNKLRQGYRTFRNRPFARGWGLPRLPKPPRLSPLSVIPIFEQLATDLSRAEPGHLYFAHLVLPHYPYAFDEKCEIRPDPRAWLGHTDLSHGVGNSVEARAQRYQLYLAQVECTQNRLSEVFDRMQAAGRFAGTRIIVHGDHGSRIAHGRFWEPGPLGNLVDMHSTLFAFHEAGEASAPSYNTELVPINLLLPEVLQVEGKRLAGWNGKAQVFFNSALQPMPDFEAGRVVERPARRSGSITDGP